MIDKKKLAGIVLAGVLTVAGTTSAFAADANDNVKVPLQRQFFRIDKSEITEKIKSALDNLVSSGTITQEQADAVSKACIPGERVGAPQEKLQLRFKSPLDSLVTAGTITQAQADAFIEAMKTARESEKSATDVLKDLVAAGTITQAQADAISNELKTKVESRLQPLKDRSGPFRGGIERLVDEGTITQEQADEFEAAIKSSTEKVLKEFVEAGKITQAQADAIQKIHTPFEGKGLFMKLGKNPLDELVSAGTITQAQAEAINEAVKAALKPSDNQ